MKFDKFFGRLLLALVVAGMAVSAEQTTFRSGIGAVAVYASVTDREGRFVPDLQASDFTVFDNGTPVPLTLFSNEPQPATVALLLDMSDSIITKVPRVRDAAGQFIEALQPGDRVRLGTFGSEVSISPLLTGDHAVLSHLLTQELWPGGATPLWNALYAGMTSLEREGGRRVVLSLTDGTNSASLPGLPGSLAEVERKAVDDDFMLYAIGMEGSGLESRVVKLAETTGGGHFEVKRDADLATTFRRVAEELRRQYLLGFVPATSDGTSHRIDVRVARPGLKARARRSYLQQGTQRSIRPDLTTPTTAPSSIGAATGAARGRLAVCVVGPDGAPIRDLRADEFVVTEGGQRRPVQMVTSSDDQFTLVIDASSGNDDAGTLSLAAPTVQRREVGSLYGPSPIWDGVDQAIEQLATVSGRRGVVLVTDGRATGNHVTPADVASRAWRHGVSVSTIVTAPDQSFALSSTMRLIVHPEYAPQQLAMDTGGRYVAHRVTGDSVLLQVKVGQLIKELRQSYVLQFDAPHDREAHRVSVSVTRPGATVRAPAAYVPSISPQAQKPTAGR